MTDQHTVISVEGYPICHLNEDLIKARGLSKKQVRKLKKLHRQRHKIEEQMTRLSPETDKQMLQNLFYQWRKNAFNLQETWGFVRDTSYHRDYVLPHCRCPVMDNDERLGTFFRVITEGCIYHDRSQL